MTRASKLAPANINILLDIGNLLVRRYQLKDAEIFFDRAVKLSPNKSATLTEAGIRCRDASSFELACHYLEQARQMPNATAESLSALGWVYERLRKIDAAKDAAARAIRLSPTNPAAILIQSRLDFVSGNYSEAENRLKQLTNTTSVDEQSRIRAWYDLATILDRQGRFDEAMEAFLAAKAIVRRKAGRAADELKITRDRLKLLVESLTPDILKRWRDTHTELQPSMSLALLGGHPRSGTTLLEQVIDSHPEAISAEETDVFHDDAFLPLVRHLPANAAILHELEQMPISSIRQARLNYVSRMEIFLGKPIGSKLLVDKNPSLTLTVPHLVRLFPEIKFLVALRDPRDVCMSCFMQPVTLNQVSYAWLSIEGTIEEYISLMGSWRTTAPKLSNEWLEVRYEDMVDNLEPVARKTLNFLQLSWDEKVLGFDAHARQKAVRSPTYSDVTKKVFKTAVGRWRNYQKYFEPHLEKLEPLAKALGYE
jgi:tetratricopeptide (TPR) repeat protein